MWYIDWLGCMWWGPTACGFYWRFAGLLDNGFCNYSIYDMTGLGPHYHPDPDWVTCSDERAAAVLRKFQEEQVHG